MSFSKLVCPNCGAAIELSENREYGFCTYCGTKVIQDKVVVEHRGKVSISGVADVQALLDRVTFFLEDKQFDKALDYCERALDIDPRNPDAYIAKLMSQTHCSQIELLANNEKPLKRYVSFNKAMRFASQDKKDILLSYFNQSVVNFKKSLNTKNAQLDEVEKALTSYRIKSEQANLWAKHSGLSRGILIGLIGIMLPGMITESGVNVLRLIIIILASILFALITSKKRKSAILDEQYKKYQIHAERVYKEYEDWAKWIDQDEM